MSQNINILYAFLELQNEYPEQRMTCGVRIKL